MTSRTEQLAHVLGTRALAEAMSLGGLFGVARSEISFLLLLRSHVRSLSVEIQRILYSSSQSCTLNTTHGILAANEASSLMSETFLYGCFALACAFFLLQESCI